MKGDAVDPKALIREAYQIEGIGEAECRTIFMDWALSVADGQSARDLLPVLIERHAAAEPDHPMSSVLREGMATTRPAARRGGWRGRRGLGPDGAVEDPEGSG